MAAWWHVPGGRDDCITWTRCGTAWTCVYTSYSAVCWALWFGQPARLSQGCQLQISVYCQIRVYFRPNASEKSQILPDIICTVMGLLQLRYEHDSTTIRLRFGYNTLRGFSCARIRDRIRESVIGMSCMLIDSSMHTAFTVYLYRPTLHRACEYARNCLYKGN